MSRPYVRKWKSVSSALISTDALLNIRWNRQEQISGVHSYFKIYILEERLLQNTGVNEIVSVLFTEYAVSCVAWS